MVQHHLDCKQFLHKSVERPTFLRQSCFVMETNKMTEEGLGRASFDLKSCVLIPKIVLFVPMKLPPNL